MENTIKVFENVASEQFENIIDSDDEQISFLNANNIQLKSFKLIDNPIDKTVRI
jgi:hypothetical protein